MNPMFLLAGIEVAIALFLGYNKVYVPYQGQARLNRVQVAEEQATRQMQAEMAELLTQEAQYRARLPEEPDPSLLVRDVVELAQQSGVQLASITRESPQPLSQVPLTRLNVTLQGSGSYHQVGMFFDALERSERFFRIERFDISGAASQGVPTVQVVVSTLHVPSLLPAAEGTTP